MEVKRICQWCGKPFIAQKTTTCYCSPQCSKRGYKHRMMERKMELRHMQEMQELRSSLKCGNSFLFSSFDGRWNSDVVSVCSTVPSDFSFPVSFKDDSRAVSILPSDGSMSDISVPVMASHSSLVKFFFVAIHF